MIRFVIACLALFALSFASCVAPGLGLLTLEQRSDPIFVAESCKVDPVGFDGVLRMTGPSVALSNFASRFYSVEGWFQAVHDDGVTVFSLVAMRHGEDWEWIKWSPTMVLPGDISIPALKTDTQVLPGGSVVEVFSYPLSRERMDQFAKEGLVADVAGRGRTSLPSGLFAGLLTRWEAELALAYDKAE